MKHIILLFFYITTFTACKKEIKGNPNRFKNGVFEVPAGDNYSKTTIIRKDSLNIEQYTKTVSIFKDSITTDKTTKYVDTLFIKWLNNFSYTLNMKNPKTKLDAKTTFVQITKVTDSSYSFKARIGYSKFEQEGTVYKTK